MSYDEYDPNQRSLDDAKPNQKRTDESDNKAVKRGNKFDEYTVVESIDPEYYDGEIWKPENPDVEKILIGKYIDCMENVGQYNRKMYVIDGDRLDGVYDKVYGCTSLNRQMEKVEPDSVISIEYCGMKTGKMNQYKDFKVRKLYKP